MTLKQIYTLCLRPGDTCFDVGANTGQSAEIMAPLVGPTGHCHSFECHPVHFTRLAFLASRPGFENILPYCRALSDRPGHIILYTGSDPGATQASTIVPELAIARRLGTSIARIKVETDTIDRFCAAHDVSPNMIKVDVEGAEAEVFAGTRATLARCQPHLVFEFGHGFDAGQTPSHYFLLHELGYELFLIDLFWLHGGPFSLCNEDPVLFSITPKDIARSRTSGNILALHRTKSAALLKNIQLVRFADIENRLVSV